MLVTASLLLLIIGYPDDKREIRIENDDLVITLRVNTLVISNDTDLELNFEVSRKSTPLQLIDESEYRLSYNTTGSILILDWGGDYSSNIVTEVKLIDVDTSYTLTKRVSKEGLRKEFKTNSFEIVLNFGYIVDRLRPSYRGLFLSDAVEEHLKQIQQKTFTIKID